jgi:acetolactate synthase I/II/III large subunit
VSGTDLRNPDFVQLAQSYGAYAEAVTDTADFPAAFTRARAAGTLALLDLRVDPDALTPTASLTV